MYICSISVSLVRDVNCSVIYLFHAGGSCEDCQHYVEASPSVYFKVYVGFTIFQQLGLERELIKLQGNLEAEMNMRNQANSAKADVECKLLVSVL